MSISNHCRFVGHCASDPVMVKTKSGKPMAKVAIYTKDHSQYALSDKDDYHWCIFLGKLAERANQLIMKGDQVHVCGKLQYFSQMHEGKCFQEAQILVEDFSLTTKSAMTKAVYQKLFPKDFLPYSVGIKLEDQTHFSLMLSCKLWDLSRNMPDEDFDKREIVVEFFNPDHEAVLFCLTEDQAERTENHFIEETRFDFLPIPASKDGIEFSDMQLKVFIQSGEKPYFEASYQIKDIVFGYREGKSRAKEISAWQANLMSGNAIAA